MQSFVTQSLHLSNFRIQWKHRGAKTSLRVVAPCHSVQLQERIRRLGPLGGGYVMRVKPQRLRSMLLYEEVRELASSLSTI